MFGCEGFDEPHGYVTDFKNIFKDYRWDRKFRQEAESLGWILSWEKDNLPKISRPWSFIKPVKSSVWYIVNDSTQNLRLSEDIILIKWVQIKYDYYTAQKITRDDLVNRQQKVFHIKSDSQRNIFIPYLYPLHTFGAIEWFTPEQFYQQNSTAPTEEEYTSVHALLDTVIFYFDDLQASSIETNDLTEDKFITQIAISDYMQHRITASDTSQYDLVIKQFLIDKITYSSQTGIDSLKIFTKSLIEIYKQASETMLSSIRNDTVDMSEYNDTKSEFLELTNNHIFFSELEENHRMVTEQQLNQLILSIRDVPHKRNGIILMIESQLIAMSNVTENIYEELFNEECIREIRVYFSIRNSPSPNVFRNYCLCKQEAMINTLVGTPTEPITEEFFRALENLDDCREILDRNNWN